MRKTPLTDSQNSHKPPSWGCRRRVPRAVRLAAHQSGGEEPEDHHGFFGPLGSLYINTEKDEGPNIMSNLYATLRGAALNFARGITASAMVFCAALLMPLQAHAVAYSCTGKVEHIAVGLNGIVTVSFVFPSGNMTYQAVCSVSDVYNTVPAAACKSMMALFITARTMQQNVQMYFDNATPGNCSAVNWANIKDLGWYWGPVLLP